MTDELTISDEAVEAAAKAIAKNEPGCAIFPSCVTQPARAPLIRPDSFGCACRKDAREALTAALPYLATTDTGEVERLVLDLREIPFTPGRAPQASGPDWQRWTTHRCPNMDAHMFDQLPQPCAECYAVEHLTRKVPYAALAAADRPAETE